MNWNKLNLLFAFLFCATMSLSCEDSNDEIGGGGNNYEETSLEAPRNLTVTVEGDFFYLKWDPVEGANQYHIYISESIGGNYERWKSVNRPSAALQLFDTGITYYFKVTAVGGYPSTESEFSNVASAKIADQGGNDDGGNDDGGNDDGGNDDGGNDDGGNDDPIIDKTPAKPTNVRAVQDGDAIVLTWNQAENATSYHVYYVRPAPYDIETYEYTVKTSMTFNAHVEGVWTFWVVGVNSDYKTGPASSKVTCRVTLNSGGGNGGGGSTQSKLDTPKNLEASSSAYYVQISFDEVSLAYEYELYRSTSSSSGYKKISAVGGSSGSRYVLTDQSPLSGTSYYKVKAKALSYLGIEDSDYSQYVKVVR
uniref:hypothetical protein n=1 Tax=Alistipes sp. TaxID=1872444 RepID=UPI0040571510